MPKKPHRKATASEGFCRRLEAEMLRLGLSQGGIADRLRTSQGTISGWFNRGYLPHPRTLAALSDLLGVRPEWLLNGEEPKLNDRSQAVGEQVVKSVPLSIGEKPKSYSANKERSVLWVPLISWAQAGIATAFETIPEEWQERIPAVVNDQTAFAISIRGDSMEPKYQEGDAVIVLPRTTARNGDLVIANIKEEGFAFKILTLVGGDPSRIRLTSYNQAYPPMEFPREQFHWIYPVHSVNKVIRR